MPEPDDSDYRFEYFEEKREIDAYLYGNQGPWPQPAPAYPTALIPQVLHLPPGEQDLWSRKVARTYLWEMLTRWPAGLCYAWRHPHQSEIDDALFSQQMAEGLYSKFHAELDEVDRKAFAALLHDGPTWRKVDGTHMNRLVGRTNPGVHVAATVTLLRRDGDNPARAVAIHLPASGLTLTPDDPDRHAWNLARYFVLQGAAHRINLIDHPLMHFPSDSANAVSKTILPKDHWLLQLLLPHLYLSLGVNHAVLEGDQSIVNRAKWVIYAPFAAPGGVVRGLLTYAFLGDHERKNGYPRYRFQIDPIFPDSLFGAFLRAYHEVISAFVGEVVAHCLAMERDGSPGIASISLWADHIAQWLPGFPSAEAIWQGDTLARTVSTIIWTVSAAHAADHNALHSMRPCTVPFRLRVPPPADARGKEFHPADLNNRFDVFQAWAADALFYQPHNHSLLGDVDYGFADAALQGMNRRFRAALRAKDNELREQGRIPVFAPLDNISTSIQY